jgi:hypothetical protein
MMQETKMEEEVRGEPSRWFKRWDSHKEEKTRHSIRRWCLFLKWRKLFSLLSHFRFGSFLFRSSLKTVL